MRINIPVLLIASIGTIVSPYIVASNLQIEGEYRFIHAYSSNYATTVALKNTNNPGDDWHNLGSIYNRELVDPSHPKNNFGEDDRNGKPRSATLEIDYRDPDSFFNKEYNRYNRKYGLNLNSFGKKFERMILHPPKEIENELVQLEKHGVRNILIKMYIGTDFYATSGILQVGPYFVSTSPKVKNLACYVGTYASNLSYLYEEAIAELKKEREIAQSNSDRETRNKIDRSISYLEKESKQTLASETFRISEDTISIEKSSEIEKEHFCLSQIPVGDSILSEGGRDSIVEDSLQYLIVRIENIKGEAIRIVENMKIRNKMFLEQRHLNN